MPSSKTMPVKSSASTYACITLRALSSASPRYSPMEVLSSPIATPALRKAAISSWVSPTLPRSIRNLMPFLGFLLNSATPSRNSSLSRFCCSMDGVPPGVGVPTPPWAALPASSAPPSALPPAAGAGVAGASASPSASSVPPCTEPSSPASEPPPASSQPQSPDSTSRRAVAALALSADSCCVERPVVLGAPGGAPCTSPISADTSRSNRLEPSTAQS
mmetsp:Transcript_11112/g.34473  ORF Transcript_11112/g.34473 Transcript_11112/m.34473 type:complete len:218 (+) Transcript_11112:3028-3681(+)